jgi:AAA domain
MARYLINLDKDDKIPKYLTHTKVSGNQLNEDWDLPDDNTGNEDSEFIIRDEPVKVEMKGKDGEDLVFKILEADSWPDAEQLGLDSSQYRALQAALTKELVVIQGPPGTGKTFMALKLAEVLIRNKERMGRTTPLLVVCLTNHALDQFLVGMMSFTEKIVRIGGQSKRKELDTKNLKNMTFSHSKNQLSMIIGHEKELSALNDLQDKVEQSLYAVEKGLNSKEGFVVSGIKLEKVMLLQHELVGEYLTWFLGTENGYVTFDQLRASINEWKESEDINIFFGKRRNKLSESEAKGFEEVVNQCAHYLQAELNFLESHFCSFEHGDSEQAPASRGISRNGRLFQMGIDEKLNNYFQSLASARKVLVSKRLELKEKASKVSQILDELQYMGQIELLKDQDVIGLTTTGAARLYKLLSTVGCQSGKIATYNYLFVMCLLFVSVYFLVIVEEAAEVLESQVVSCLSEKCQQLILIGNSSVNNWVTVFFKMQKNLQIINLFC